jgi:hypothetical protein
MTRDSACRLRYSSKLDRSQQHMENLHDEGRQVAQQWLAGWKQRGDDFDCYPNDARYREGGAGC